MAGVGILSDSGQVGWQDLVLLAPTPRDVLAVSFGFDYTSHCSPLQLILICNQAAEKMDFPLSLLYVYSSKMCSGDRRVPSQP